MSAAVRRLLLLLVPLLTQSSYAEIVLPAPATGMYFGVYASYTEGQPETLTNAIADFKTQSGKSVVWGIVLSEWGGSLAFPKDEVMAVHNQGAMPFVRILPRTVADETYAIDPVLRLDYIVRGDFDAQIRTWADGARDIGFPILAEFGPEPNGFWNQWSGIFYQNGPALYASAVQHVIALCRAEGAKNITWFFHMNGLDNPVQANNQMAQYYPGDTYIDWMGVSVLGAQTNSQYWDIFADVMDPAYLEITGVSSTKPVALIETAVIEDPRNPTRKAEWYTAAFKALKSNRWPRLKAYSYWNEVSGISPEVDDMRINSSPQALQAFRTGILDPFFIAGPLFSLRH